MLFHQFNHPDSSHADPDGKSEKRPNIGIVTLARLQRGLVEEYDNGKACHNKQGQYREGPLPVSLKMEYHAKQTQQEWQVEIAVMGRVVLVFTFCKSGLPTGILYISFPAYKIPVKVPDVHMIDLVINEKIPVAAVVAVPLQVGPAP